MAVVDVVHLVDVEVQGRTRVRFAVDPTADDDPIAVWLRHSPVLDDPPIDLVLSLLEATGRRGRLVDVGAHLGTISLTAATLGHRVVAVEASPRNAQLLRCAAAHAGLTRLVPVHAFAGDGGGTVTFVAHGPWGHEVLDDERTAGRATVEVPSTPVDLLLQRSGWAGADVVKIDVEGGEPAALRGMVGLLASEPPPAVVIESNLPALEGQGSSGPAILRLLEAAGYRLHLLDRARRRTLVPFASGELQTETVADLLATKGAPPSLPGWVVAPPLGPDDVVERLLATAAAADAHSRAYAAGVIATSPRLRSHPELALALRTLAFDPDPSVRRAAPVAATAAPTPAEVAGSSGG